MLKQVNATSFRHQRTSNSTTYRNQHSGQFFPTEEQRSRRLNPGADAAAAIGDRQRFFEARTLLINEQREREKDMHERRVRVFEAERSAIMASSQGRQRQHNEVHVKKIQFWEVAIDALRQKKSVEVGDNIATGVIQSAAGVRND